jgi:hypothetical protein
MNSGAFDAPGATPAYRVGVARERRGRDADVKTAIDRLSAARRKAIAASA